MDEKEALIQAKKDLSGLIIDILAEKISVPEATKYFPQDNTDETIECAIHAIYHYDADEDYRKNDPEYFEEQKDYLEYIADVLRNGENLPINIIEEYKNFYEIAPIRSKKGIINTLKNLFKFIN